MFGLRRNGQGKSGTCCSFNSIKSTFHTVKDDERDELIRPVVRGVSMSATNAEKIYEILAPMGNDDCGRISRFVGKSA